MKAGYIVAFIAVAALAFYVVKTQQDSLSTPTPQLQPRHLSDAAEEPSEREEPKPKPKPRKDKDSDKRLVQTSDRAPAPPVTRDRSDNAEAVITDRPEDENQGMSEEPLNDTSHLLTAKKESSEPAAPAPEPSTIAPAESTYVPPDLTKQLFVTESLPISPDDRAALATATADYVRGLPNNATKNAETSARFLGIALRLDSRNRNAIVTNGQLRRGGATTASDPKFTASNYAKQLVFAVKALKNAGDENSGKLATYLIDMAATADPGNEDAIYFAESSAKPDWAAIVPPAASATAAADPAKTPEAAAGDVPTLKRDKAVVKTMVVQDLPAGQTAAPSELTISAVAEGDTTQYLMPTPSTEDARIASDIARYYVASRPVASKVKARLTVTLPGENARLPGSAGIALALAAVSVLENIELDPGVAVTGDITAVGATERANWLTARINGAAAAASTLLAVPHANVAEVADAALLSSPAPLARTQIFGVTTLDDALAVARKDRTANLQKAIDLFAAFAKELDSSASPASLAKAGAATRLKEILTLAPNHLSAKYLLELANGTAPRRLTQRASIEQVFEAARPILQIYSPTPSGNTYNFAPGDYTRVDRALTAKAPLLAPDCEEFYFSIKALISAIEVFNTMYGEVPAMRQASGYLTSHPNDPTRVTKLRDIDSRRVTCALILQKLNPDPEVLLQIWR
ncbi:hypothetical protein DB346_09510 [Verrucomicrobia bacterium LW23]|nr:hypothetical protein DB346_09510 [Verrucomicrobia bacterium LW23]